MVVKISWSPKIKKIKETAKGQVLTDETTTLKFIKKLGEEHPFDFKKALGAYLTVPFVTGAIDKHVDFAVGGGFYVTVKDDERAEQILTDFMTATNFDTLLRQIIRDVLIFGNSFVEIVREKNQITELRPLNPQHIYIKRDTFGNIEGYVQWFEGSLLKLSETVEFKPNEIAHFSWNVTGDAAYGYGIIAPHLEIIKQKLLLEKDMQTIYSRKANPLYVFKLGSDTFPVPQSELDTLKADLESLKANQDFVMNHTFQAQIVEPSALGEKFIAPFEHYENQLVYGFQVPIVLLGKGSIPEGLAKVQLDAFERRIKSIQEAVEKILETNLFKPILEANGFPNIHAEFEWGQPSQEDEQNELLRITELLKILTLSPIVKAALEKRVLDLLGLEAEVPEETEGRDMGFDMQPQPRVPAIPQTKPEEKLKEMLLTQEQIDNLPLKEYVGFKNKLEEAFSKLGITFDQYARDAIDYIKSKDYHAYLKTLEGVNAKELQKVLQEGFANGWSVYTMARNIRERADLEPIGNVSIQDRSLNMARTETIRISTDITLDRYEKSGVVEKVEWLATMDARVCDICNSLSGQIAELKDLPTAWKGGPGWVHNSCRCVLLPVLKEGFTG